MKTIAEKIRDQRLALDLTQQELADRAGITNRTISNYETGAAKPRGIQLRRLCEVLGITEEYLMNPEIEDPSHGLESAPYVEAVRKNYGRKGARELQELLEANQALFAGGEIPQEDKDLFFNAVMEAYVANKEKASENFTPNSKRSRKKK